MNHDRVFWSNVCLFSFCFFPPSILAPSILPISCSSILLPYLPFLPLPVVTFLPSMNVIGNSCLTILPCKKQSCNFSPSSSSRQQSFLSHCNRRLSWILPCRRRFKQSNPINACSCSVTCSITCTIGFTADEYHQACWYCIIVPFGNESW